MSELLHSEYIIDGVRQSLTPAQMLDDCLSGAPDLSDSAVGRVVDESLDPVLGMTVYSQSDISEYLRKVQDCKSFRMPLAYASSYTQGSVCRALIDTIWKDGHFRLGDIDLKAEWKCDPSQVGHPAAFYMSAQALADCADALNLKLRGYSVREARNDSFAVSASLSVDRDYDGLSAEIPFRTKHPVLSSGAIASEIDPDPTSWIIYIPFDNCDYSLGGSALSQAVGPCSDPAPEFVDPDYFIDCYEVVREMVEDGILLSGATVGAGGLMCALSRMCGSRTGAEVHLADLRKATGVNDPVRLLFSEVPGVVIQIRDIDYDYVDAELLLQDVAFYPLGHPVPGSAKVHVGLAEKTGVQAILESLIRSQSSEGED